MHVIDNSRCCTADNRFPTNSFLVQSSVLSSRMLLYYVSSTQVRRLCRPDPRSNPVNARVERTGTRAGTGQKSLNCALVAVSPVVYRISGRSEKGEFGALKSGDSGGWVAVF